MGEQVLIVTARFFEHIAQDRRAIERSFVIVGSRGRDYGGSQPVWNERHGTKGIAANVTKENRLVGILVIAGGIQGGIVFTSVLFHIVDRDSISVSDGGKSPGGLSRLDCPHRAFYNSRVEFRAANGTQSVTAPSGEVCRSRMRERQGGLLMGDPTCEIVSIGVSGARIVGVTRERIDYIDAAGEERFIDLEECARSWER